MVFLLHRQHQLCRKRCFYTAKRIWPRPSPHVVWVIRYQCLLKCIQGAFTPLETGSLRKAFKANCKQHLSATGKAGFTCSPIMGGLLRKYKICNLNLLLGSRRQLDYCSRWWKTLSSLVDANTGGVFTVMKHEEGGKDDLNDVNV